MAEVEGAQRVSIGRVFSRTFGAIGSDPVTFFGIALLFGGVPSVLLNRLQMGLRLELAGSTSAFVGALAVTILGAVINMVLQALVQGALVRATLAYSEGGRAGFGESALTGLKVALPMIGLVLLFVIGTGIGVLLLIVPGVILYLMWAVAAPALVAERRGVFESFGRSRFLTKGARLKILGLNIVVLLLCWMLAAALGAVLLAMYGMHGLPGAVQTGFPVGWVIASAVITALATVFSSTVQTALYIELRDWKDGPASDRLADIFG